MSEAKLDQILEKLSGLDQKVTSLDQKVASLDQKVTGLDRELALVRSDVTRMEARQAETVVAFKHHWGDLADLYRRVREDVKHFEDRVESKLSQINQSIQALRDSVERQDFRADELGRRIARLEDQPPPHL